MLLFGMGVGFIILIIGYILLRPCFLFWCKHRRLRLHGITVQGSVTERHLEHLSNGQPWYYLTCRYTYEGRPYVCDQPVWRDHYERGESLVSVCCLPSNPEIATVVGDDFQRVEWVQRTLLAMVLILVGTFILIGLPGLFTARHPYVSLDTLKNASASLRKNRLKFAFTGKADPQNVNKITCKL